MKKQEKRDLIFKELAKHNDVLINQAGKKLNKKLAPCPEDARELVSDVFFTIINNCFTDKGLNKYFTIYNDGMLFNYVAKAVDINARFLNAPFLRKKIAIMNRIAINPDRKYSELFECDDERLILIEYIESLLHNKQQAKRLFGNKWKYFTTIFIEYTKDTSTTYSSLSKKYDIPRSSIANHINIVKQIILKNLKENEDFKNY